jgi:hypothetical protein
MAGKTVNVSKQSVGAYRRAEPISNVEPKI